jgi:hypothetical protein
LIFVLLLISPFPLFQTNVGLSNVSSLH